MKSIFALAVLATVGLSAPAFAQDAAGQPGAVGTGGSLTGSTTGTSGPNATVHTRRYMGRSMSYHHRMMRHHHHMMMHHKQMMMNQQNGM